MNDLGLRETGFVVPREYGGPGSHRVHNLTSLNNVWANRVLKPATQVQAGTALGPLDKEGCLARGLYLQEQSGEGRQRLSH